MRNENTWLEDIAATIGYSAATKLVGWYGGANLSIPKTPDPECLIGKLIGPQAFAILVEEFGGQIVPIPNDTLRDEVRRDRIIYELLSKGVSLRIISNVTDMSTRNVLHIRSKLEENGILPMVLKG